jgi:hypothetical protein
MHTLDVVYVCLEDYLQGPGAWGNKYFKSVEELKMAHPTWEHCGIVEVFLISNRIIEEPLYVGEAFIDY